MCGIFAWAGKNPTKFNKSQFNILGIINETRGKHSCGITLDGDIKVGIDTNKVYRDFMQNVDFEKPVKYPYVIGHTRHATGGAHDIYNAHPFGYGNIEQDNEWLYEFVGVHNGSLENHKDLAIKRNISLTFETKTSKHETTIRTKIDSEILLECVYKDKDWKVLSEYNGAAALVFVNNNEPNVIYCYHGKSKQYNWANSKVEEERPLYYYKETRNSLYISSISESLVVIGGNDDTIGEFDHNTVYKITDGDITKAVKFKISRANNYQKESYNNYGGYDFEYFPKTKKTYDDYTDKIDVTYPSRKSGEVKYNTDENIYDEKVDFSVYGSKIYLEKLRYWRTGHLINGIYCFIKGYNNLCFLGKSMKEAEEFFWSKVNKPFHDGMFINYDSEYAKDAIVPFVHTNENEIVSLPFLFFYEGIRLRDELDYMSCIESAKTKRGWLYTSLSCCSSHPVININNKKAKDDQQILLNNQPFTGNISPLLSEKIYNIKDGNLISWKYTKDNEKPSTPNLLIVKDIKEVFDDIDVKEKEAKKNDEFLSERLEKEIEEIFTAPYKKFPSILKQLDRYSHLEKGQEAITVIEEFIEGISNLITIEIKE